LEIVGFDAPLGRGPLGQEPLEDAPRDPDHAAHDRPSFPFALTVDPTTSPEGLGTEPARAMLIPSSQILEEPH